MRVRAILAGLLLIWLAAGARAQDDAHGAFHELLREYDRAHAEYLVEKRAAGPLTAVPHPGRTFRARFEAGAEDHAGSDAAVPYLNWLLHHAGGREQRTQMAEALFGVHLASPALSFVAHDVWKLSQQAGRSRVDGWIAAILAGNEHPEARAGALYSRAKQTLRAPSLLRTRESRESALADLRSAVELAPGAAFTQDALGVLFREGKVIGERAPEIEGVDLDGHAFRLSDYVGKVVVLDFWGDW